MSNQAQSHPYFQGHSPRIFAHRGLHTHHPENTRGAFQAALDAGAAYIETDVVGSRDGIAMISHDVDLARVTGQPGLVADFTAEELGRIELGGGQTFFTLADALREFPTVRFNIDVKDQSAIAGTVASIREAAAEHRVLVSSFSARRRRATVAQLPGVATSTAASEFFRAWLQALVGLTPRMSSFHAVQIPERYGWLRVVTPAILRRFHRASVEVHVWTLNDPADMRRLAALGVDGVVTDRCDVALREIGPHADSVE